MSRGMEKESRKSYAGEDKNDSAPAWREQVQELTPSAPIAAAAAVARSGPAETARTPASAAVGPAPARASFAPA
eukprot:CAMPEP_0113234108 /NCGR_PEP_ID=MMETSP0008_2-20120614/2842_1 /TAXON_ID=97485 /ORGANISM="Prymnesium parvum" /LENGTH=73 /DNA_ID=CAMNT_0000080937 /DNA_START=1735 /DNA_END=1956 /DNA_ORIENTATION=+ /assembly_acc=CAM_ASM_000153